MVTLAILSVIILAVINTMYYTNLSNYHIQYNQLIKQQTNSVLSDKFKQITTNSLPINNKRLINTLNTQKPIIINELYSKLGQYNIIVKDINFSVKNSKYLTDKENKRQVWLVDLKTSIEVSIPRFPNKTLITTTMLNITLNKNANIDPPPRNLIPGIIKISSPI
ncbi:MAG: hypothetical protein ACP5O4_05225, partial [bacterium]